MVAAACSDDGSGATTAPPSTVATTTQVPATSTGATTPPTTDATTAPPDTTAPNTTAPDTTAAPTTVPAGGGDHTIVSIYPSLSLADVQAAANLTGATTDSIDLVRSFADDFLEMDNAEVRSTTDGSDAEGWNLFDGSLDVDVTTEILANNQDGEIVWGITHASSFGADERFFLSAKVAESDGVWTAEFGFPALGTGAFVSFASGDWDVSANSTIGEVLLTLPAEPLEAPRFLLLYEDEGVLVGIHGITLSPGAFAAG